MTILIGLLITAHVIVCILMVLAVLMQLPRSEGLGAAFGGGMTENIFGAQTTHVLAKFTVWLGIAFFAITLLLAIAFAHNRPSVSRIEQDLQKAAELEEAAKATATPAATPAAAPVAAPAATVAPEAISTPAPVASPEAAVSPEAAPAVEAAASPAVPAEPAASATP